LYPANASIATTFTPSRNPWHSYRRSHTSKCTALDSTGAWASFLRHEERTRQNVAATGGIVPGFAQDLPDTTTTATIQMTLTRGPEIQCTQSKQSTTIERAKLTTKPCDFSRFNLRKVNHYRTALTHQNVRSLFVMPFSALNSLRRLRMVILCNRQQGKSYGR
jgi:hypothetical protein